MFWHLLLALQVLLNVAKGSNQNQSHEAGASMVTATISPHQPLVWSRGHVILTCSLPNSTVNVNSSDLNFYSSSPEISQKLKWERLNRTSIFTNVTDINRNMSSENISCGFQNETLDQVTLNVADPIQCIVRNWLIMVCTWEKFQFGNDANITLLYNRLDCRRDRKIYTCPNMKSNETHGECIWNTSQFLGDRSYFMLVTHCLRMKIQRPSPPTLYKLIGPIDVHNIVKPNPVSNCRVGSINANHSVIITWATPNKEHKVIYRVNLTSKWSASTKNTNETKMLLENLIPNTNYTATVDCIPLTIKETMVGFWSDPVSVTFITASDVPGAAPRVTPGGYKETSRNLSFRGIELFFQPPNERYSHGQIKGYQIKSYRVNFSSTDSPSNSVFPKYENKTSADLILESDADYSFTVEAETASGYNSSLTLDRIFIPSQLKKPPFPKQFVVKGDGNGDGNGLYFLSWDLMSNVSSYTLYWCNSLLRSILCLDTLQWKTFLPNQTSAELKDIGHPREGILRFFISAEKVLSTGHVISSGMLMSNCTYMKNGDLRPPHGFHISGVGSSSLTAEWSQPDETSCQHRAYPDAYVIVYCITNKCHHGNVTVRVKSSSDSFQINGLEPGTEYSIMIKSVSKDGRTSRFEQRNQSMEDNLSPRNDNLIIVISIIGGVLCILCAVIGLAYNLRRCIKKLDIKITPPEMYHVKNTGIPSGKSCYSSFDSSNDKGQYAAHMSVSGASEELLPRKEALSVSSSCHTETSLLSSSSIEAAKSDNVSAKSGNISGYNKVVERPWLLANGSHNDSGTSLPNSISLSGSMDDAVFIDSLDD